MTCRALRPSPLPTAHQRQDGERADPVAHRRSDVMPFDFPQGSLTQAAYALATLSHGLSQADLAGQHLLAAARHDERLNSDAEAADWWGERTFRDASRFHVAVSSIPGLSDLIEYLAPFEDEIFTLVAALMRGEHVRLICTPVSSTPEPAVVMPLASEAA